ncbi:5-formyltetrahydrofolate cyclo-ligase, partial [bacterium]
MVFGLDKADWRRELLRRRNSLPTTIRRRAARVITLALLTLPELRTAKTIGLYADFRGEVPTVRLGLLLSLAGKTVALPVSDPRQKSLVFRRVDHWHQLCRGTYAIREPNRGCPLVAARALDLLVVPGVGFDRRGYRLGYGMGYYDRLLAELAPGCTTVGLAFACQVVP